MTDTTHDDLVRRLHSLHKQATVERSHFYVGRCAKDAIDHIEELSNCVAVLEAELAKAVEAMQFWSEAVEPDVDKAITLMASTLAELKRKGR